MDMYLVAYVGLGFSLLTFLVTNFFRTPKEQTASIAGKMDDLDRDFKSLQKEFHELKYQVGNQHLNKNEIEALLNRELRPIVESFKDFKNELKDFKNDLVGIRAYLLDINKHRVLPHVV